MKNSGKIEKESVDELTALRQEVGELREKEEALLKAGDRLEMAQRIGRVGVWDWNPGTGELLWTDEVFRILGYSVNEVTPSYELFLERIHPEDRERLKKAVADSLEGEASYNVDCRIIMKDGEVRYASAQGEMQFGGDGNPLRMLGTFQDMTKCHETEEALVEANARLEQVLKASPAIIYRCDLKGDAVIPTFVSSNVKEQLGYEVEDYIEDPGWWASHLHLEDSDDVLTEFGRVVFSTREDNFAHEYRFMKKNGDYVWVRDELNIFRDNDGKAENFVGSWLDISTKKEAEEARLKLEKLEAVGVLAGGIAHDFNNILTSINANVSRMKKTAGLDGKNMELLEGDLTYAKEITQQLLTFATGGMPIKKLSSISVLLETTATLALSGSHVKADFNLQNDLFTAEVDEGQLCQVINNLVINAVQAMPKSGTVTVSAKNFIKKDKDRIKLPAGKYICITIADEGKGIDKGVLPKIFDPYFTTKPGGNGLGLSTAYSVVTKHGGLIDVESEKEKGTTFRVYLPALEEKLLEVEERTISFPPVRKRILMMDDEERLRKSVGFLLDDLGYDVAFAADGKEALEIFNAERAAGLSFDVVFLDLTVPGGMGGEETMERLLEIDPAVKAVVTSGYSNNNIMANYESYGFAAMLPKPYDIGELNETLLTVIKKAV